MNSTIEEWADVPGFIGTYWVSTEGRVLSRRRERTPGGILKPYANGQGYATVQLKHNKITRRVKLHKLVMETFVGPCPPKLQVRHLNGDKTDARLSNLAYGTSGQNQRDTVAHGNHPMARKTHCPQGHPYGKKAKNGSRYCSICRADYKRKSYRQGVDQIIQSLTMTNRWAAITVGKTQAQKEIREELAAAAEKKRITEAAHAEADAEFRALVVEAVKAGVLPLVKIADAAQVSRSRIYQILATKV